MLGLFCATVFQHMEAIEADVTQNHPSTSPPKLSPYSYPQFTRAWLELARLDKPAGRLFISLSLGHIVCTALYTFAPCEDTSSDVPSGSGCRLYLVFPSSQVRDASGMTLSIDDKDLDKQRSVRDLLLPASLDWCNGRQNVCGTNHSGPVGMVFNMGPLISWAWVAGISPRSSIAFVTAGGFELFVPGAIQPIGELILGSGMVGPVVQ
ncbi:hypothetical protein DFH09DRAFT_1091060 [Mycena vulgaris]|nr:hypothetical protein DFH09DRAFT_1091060 [Mycena vulgaris]